MFLIFIHLFVCNSCLLKQPWSEGYIAILLPFLKDYEKHKSKLLTYDQYQSGHSPVAEKESEIDTTNDKSTEWNSVIVFLFKLNSNWLKINIFGMIEMIII